MLVQQGNINCVNPLVSAVETMPLNINRLSSKGLGAKSTMHDLCDSFAVFSSKSIRKIYQVVQIRHVYKSSAQTDHVAEVVHISVPEMSMNFGKDPTL